VVRRSISQLDDDVSLYAFHLFSQNLISSRHSTDVIERLGSCIKGINMEYCIHEHFRDSASEKRIVAYFFKLMVLMFRNVKYSR
jgi:hypothetical protein